MFLSLKSVLLPLTFLASQPIQPAVENSASDHCGEEWKFIVSEVGNIIQSSESTNRIILFSGLDGKIFNCLNENVSPQLIEEHELHGIPISTIIREQALENDEIPVNFCSANYVILHQTEVMTISIPYRIKSLLSEQCTLRLQSLSESIPHFLRHGVP